MQALFTLAHAFLYSTARCGIWCLLKTRQAFCLKYISFEISELNHIGVLSSLGLRLSGMDSWIYQDCTPDVKGLCCGVIIVFNSRNFVYNCEQGEFLWVGVLNSGPSLYSLICKSSRLSLIQVFNSLFAKFPVGFYLKKY